MASKKLPMITIPEGTFQYPYLTRPDNFKGENYKCKSRVPLAAAKPIMDTIQVHFNNRKALDTLENNGEEVGYEKPYLPFEVDEEAGFVTFTTKMARFGGSPGNQFEQSPDVVDASLNVLDKTVDVFAGSTGVLSVQPFLWGKGSEKKIGISLRLMGAQVLTLVDKVVRTPESHGFRTQEGFDVTTQPPMEQIDGEVDSRGRETY